MTGGESVADTLQDLKVLRVIRLFRLIKLARAILIKNKKLAVMLSIYY